MADCRNGPNARFVAVMRSMRRRGRSGGAAGRPVVDAGPPMAIRRVPRRRRRLPGIAAVPGRRPRADLVATRTRSVAADRDAVAELDGAHRPAGSR